MPMTLETDTLAALEAARMRVREQTERARTAAREAARMSEDVRTLTRTAHSPGGEVSVTAQASGVVERVELSPRAPEWDVAALSRLLTDTIREAQRSASHAAVERMTETLGDESPLVADIRDRVAAQYGSDPRTELR
jgi:DNA-binding protein YbaB